MWIQLYGVVINMDNVTRFWLEQDQSTDDSIIPTLKFQMRNHKSDEWLEFEVKSRDKNVSSIELAKRIIKEIKLLINAKNLL